MSEKLATPTNLAGLREKLESRKVLNGRDRGPYATGEEAQAYDEACAAAFAALPHLLDLLDAKEAREREMERALITAKDAFESHGAGTFRTYKARNGREVGIQADDGEACDIIHSDITHECMIALDVVRSALSAGGGADA